MKKSTIRFLSLLAVMFFLTKISSAVEVTFRVDMSEQTVSSLGVHIAGSFQGWDPGATEMTLTQDNIYAVTVDLTTGETVEYKFVNGNDWGMDESVPAGCAQNNNRYLTVPGQNTELPAVCFGSCTVCNPPQVDITFQVDMSNETVSSNGVHIAGSFQGWDPSATEMQPAGNGIYTVTLAIGAGEYHEYKFVNGNDWGFDETVPPECAVGWNRYINVPFVPTTLDPVCFGSCYPCGPPPIDINVTFKVDMSEQVISPAGVHIGGGFQGWDPGATAMTDAGNNIFTYTAVMPSGTYQEYKFVNGTTWDESENVPPECGVNNNRFFTVPWNDTVMEAVCYGACGPCGPPPVDVDVTFRVDMSNETVSPDGIHLAGTFQGWNATANPMTDVGDNIYETTVTLLSGTMQEYKFINGNTFDEVENVPEACGIPDGQGGFNRYFTTPVNDTTLGVVCFGSCDPCGPPPVDVDVTFRVDMSDETISPDGVHLTGDFQGWNASANPMTDMGDNIFETTVTLSSGVTNEYKFINGNTFDFVENVPEACGVPDGQGGFNRYITVPVNDTILSLVCFGSCEPCIPPQPDHAVTFRVDMSYQTVSPDGVHLAGDFQGWNASANPMTNTGGNIYETTVMLEEGSYQEFKYINGNSFDFAETVPGICAANGNRYFTVPDADTVMTAVCFGSCDPCGPPPSDVDVTFIVDMIYETVSADGVHVAGSFQDWNPESTLLTDMGDEKYAVTVTLTAGEYYEYKFINGITFDEAEIVPEACGVPDGYGEYSRYLTAPANDTTLMAVCFSECDTCGPPPVEVNVTFRVDMTNEEVSGDGVHIAGDFQNWDPAATPMIPGQDQIYSYTTALFSGDVIEYKFINGNAWGQDETVPAACAQNNNRYIEVPAVDTLLTNVCFGSCDTCVVIGIHNNQKTADQFGFYPNPANNMLYFSAKDQTLRVSIFAPDGKLLINRTVSGGSLDLSALRKGLYFIRIEKNGNHQFSKLIMN